MKAILFLSALFLFSSFKESSAQDPWVSLEAFLKNSTAGLPQWMREHGLVPQPLDDGGEFTLTSITENGRSFYDFTGEIKNRFYHGGEKNVRTLDVKVDWNKGKFFVDLAFGDGKNDFIEGTYILSGTVSGSRVSGEGIFRNSNQQNSLHEKITCQFDIDEGYFKIGAYSTDLYDTKFDNFTMEGLNARGNEQHILPIVESWSNAPYHYGQSIPNTDSYWIDYMKELFAATPVADIIG